MQGIPSVEERNKDPLEFGYYLQDLAERAEGAYRREDWKTAVKYFKPMSVAVPGGAISHSRLCDAYGRLGQFDNAIESCSQAMSLKGAKVVDHLRFVDLMLRKPALSPDDVAYVEASLLHLREFATRHPQALPGSNLAAGPAAAEVAAPTAGPAEPAQQAPSTGEQDTKDRMRSAMAKQLLDEENAGDGAVAPVGALHLPTQIELLTCRLAVQTADMKRLPECLGRLREYSVPEELLLPFVWAEALHRGDEARAAALLKQAEQGGASKPALAAMRQEHDKAFRKPFLGVLDARWVVPAALAALLALVAVVFVRRARFFARPSRT